MSRRKIFNIGDPYQDVPLYETLNEIITGNDSDTELDFGDEDVHDDPPFYPNAENISTSDDDSDEDTPEPRNQATSSGIQESSSPSEPLHANGTPSSSRRLFWRTTNTFEPIPPAPEYVEADALPLNLPPQDYFTKYIPSDIYAKIAFCSNQTFLIRTGQHLNTDEKEIKTFLGVTLMMSYLKFPRIRMYWEKRTRMSTIADKITRDRYFKLRSALKVVTDDEVSEEERKTEFWKVQPLISCVRNGCLLNTPTTDICVDEQMIPFWGKHVARQVVRGKPNPVGLKNFVLTNSNGLPLDFFIYEGKGDSILQEPLDEPLDLGGKVVFRFSARIPAGCSIYMDRYFTSIPLLELLFHKVKCTGTGTLQKVRYRKCSFKSDAVLRREGRGSYSQQVLLTGQVAAVKWFDSKPVILASSEYGAEPLDNCRRWDKKQKKYIDVPRPFLVRKYNECMGGVDFLDRMISYYRIAARTRKWTVRLIFHMFDFAIAAGWIEYKNDQNKLGTPRKDIMDILSFREAISDYLMEFEKDDDTLDCEGSSSLLPNKKARQQHPSDFIRNRKADHMPVVLPNKNRCRFPGCSSNAARHQCSTCKVNLCLVYGRNCYQAYHEI